MYYAMVVVVDRPDEEDAFKMVEPLTLLSETQYVSQPWEVDPIAREGEQEGRDGAPIFATADVIEQHPDV